MVTSMVRFRLGSALTLGLLTLLTGCINPEIRDAAAFASQLVGAHTYEVDVHEQATGNVYRLQISDASWNKQFNKEDIVSVCALAFYNHLPNTSDVGYVSVAIDSNLGEIQKTFSSSELQQAYKSIDRVTSFFRWHPKAGIDSLRPLVNPLFFPDSLIDKIAQSVLQQDSLDNGFVKTEMIGFELDTVAQLPVVIVKLSAVRKQSRQRYDAFVGAMDERLLLVVPAKND
jgi:hypothetical protein